jgi:hypothetical protein
MGGDWRWPIAVDDRRRFYLHRNHARNSRQSFSPTSEIRYPTLQTSRGGNRQVIGYYEDTAGNFHGFLQNSSQYYSFDFQGGAGLTIARGSNGIAQAVGSYGGSGGNSQGFRLQLTPPQWTAGSFKSLSYPGANLTFATGMNNNGQVVGYYLPSGSGPFAFLYDSNTNAYSTISNSGWFNLSFGGINDATQMAGYYADMQGIYHGFIASPQ